MMASLNAAGWFVVHATWQVTLVGGIAALLLGLLRHAAPGVRYRVAGACLALMALAPVMTMASGVNASRRRMPAATLEPILAALNLPAILWWASVLIPIAGAFYLIGLVVCAARFGIELRRVRTLRAAGTAAHNSRPAHVPAPPHGWRLPARLVIRLSDRVSMPMVIGWRRPLVLMPSAIDVATVHDETQGLLWHELAHVVRRDYLANLIQVVADALLFFHPAARWLSTRIRVEREYCCDDLALDAAPDRVAYVRALASLAHAPAGSRFAVLAAGTLLDRLQRIAGEPRRVLGPARGALALVLASAVAAAILAAVAIIPAGLPWKAELRSRTPRAASEIRQPAPDPLKANR